jgi:quinol monooxygenase YgiN
MGCSDSKTTDQNKPVVKAEGLGNASASPNKAHGASAGAATTPAVCDPNACCCVMMSAKMNCQEDQMGDVKACMQCCCDEARKEEGCMMVAGFHSEEENRCGFMCMFKNMEAAKHHMQNPAFNEHKEKMMEFCDRNTMEMMCCPVAVTEKMKECMLPEQCDPENPECCMCVRLCPNDDECRNAILKNSCEVVKCTREEPGCMAFDCCMVEGCQDLCMMGLFKDKACMEEHENCEHMVKCKQMLKSMTSSQKMMCAKRVC